MFEVDRFVNPAPLLGEEQYDRAIRPKTLAEYIGQHKVREQMEIFIGAAKARSEALRARLSRLESEIAALQQAARDEGAAEEARIEQRAQEAAARVAETAQRQIRDEAARTRQELRREAVELAVKLAEGIVRDQVQASDQRRLAQEFLDIVQQADGTEGRHV